MDYAEVEAQDLVTRYDRGTLSAEEEMRFEAHLMNCPETQEALVYARSLRRGVRALAAEDALRASAAGRLVRLHRRPAVRVGLLAALLLLFAAPLLWQLRTTAPSAGTVSSPHVVMMSAMRSADDPSTIVDLGSVDGEAVLLAIDPGDEPGIETYRLTLENADGAPVFARDGLRLNALEVVMVRVPVARLRTGAHQLRVDGVTVDGSRAELARYPVRIVGEAGRNGQ
ncbi:MAG: zf-HC2 domain-containing protein [Acidobacteriota bacterium]